MCGILAALDRVGDQDDLVRQAYDSPKELMSLLGRLVPTQVTAKGDMPLSPMPSKFPTNAYRSNAQARNYLSSQRTRRAPVAPVKSVGLL